MDTFSTVLSTVRMYLVNILWALSFQFFSKKIWNSVPKKTGNFVVWIDFMVEWNKDLYGT